MAKDKELLALFDAIEIPFHPDNEGNIIDVEDEIERDEEGIPKTFVIIKFGKNRYTIDGEEGEFDFTEKDADRIIDEFNRRGRDLLIDLEHACLIPGNPAPAYGWIRNLRKGKTGLIGEVARWSDEARDLLRNRRYRYHSPTIYFIEEEDIKRPASLHSVTLTNHPALHNIAELMAANDIDDIKVPVEEKISQFRKALSKIDFELNRLYSLKGFNDENYLHAIQSNFTENMKKFNDFLHENLDKEQAIKIYDDFASMIFLSDLTEKAKAIVMNGTNPEQIEILLIEFIKDNEDNFTPAEREYAEALLESVRQDKKLKNFSDNNNPKTINQTKGRGAMENLEKEFKEMLALADDVLSDEDLKTLGLDEELPATPPEGGAGEEGMKEETPAEEKSEEKELDKVKDLVKTLVDQIKEIAKVLGIEEGNTENAEALSDLAIEKIKEMKEALDKIADAYDSDNKSPQALADLVYVNQLGAPDKEEIKKIKEKLAMSDKALKEKTAKEAVEAAIQAGNIPESRREKALKLAMADLEKFNEHFAPGKGIPIVPVEQNTQEKPEGQSEKKSIRPLSDTEKAVAKAMGIDINNPEEVAYYFRRNN